MPGSKGTDARATDFYVLTCMFASQPCLDMRVGRKRTNPGTKFYYQRKKSSTVFFPHTAPQRDNIKGVITGPLLF